MMTTMNSPERQAILSAVRTICGVVGGVFVAKGYFEEATLQIILGVITSVFPLIWGIYDKYVVEKQVLIREQEAFRQGMGSTPKVVPTELSPETRASLGYERVN